MFIKKIATALTISFFSTKYNVPIQCTSDVLIFIENFVQAEDLYESSSSSSESSVSSAEFLAGDIPIDQVLSNNVFLVMSQAFSTRGVLAGTELARLLNSLTPECTGVATSHLGSGHVYLSYAANAVNILPPDYTFSQTLFDNQVYDLSRNITRELQRIHAVSDLWGWSPQKQYTLLNNYLSPIKHLADTNIAVRYGGPLWLVV